MSPKKIKFLLFSFIFILSASGVFVPNFLPKASGQNQFALFSLSEMPQKKFDETSSAAVRESQININLTGFTRENSDVLSFPLFDGKTYEAVRDQDENIEIRGAGDFTWRGKLSDAGKPGGDVILTVKKGFVSGLIYAPNAVFEIVPRKNKQLLIEINQNAFPECGGAIQPSQIEANAPQTERNHAATSAGLRRKRNGKKRSKSLWLTAIIWCRSELKLPKKGFRCLTRREIGRWLNNSSILIRFYSMVSSARRSRAFLLRNWRMFPPVGEWFRPSLFVKSTSKIQGKLVMSPKK
jgi:hypothetical protein